MDAPRLDVLLAGDLHRGDPLFLARGLPEVDRGDFEAAHEEADMETFWVPFDDLLAAVLAGEVRDAPVIVTVLLAEARGLAGSRRAGG